MATQLVYSQEAIPVSGGDAIGPEGSGTYSVGQTFYTTYTAATGSVSQGVQQPFEFSANTNAPVIAVPENITVNTDANQCGAIVPFAATDATGIPNSVITYDIQPDSFFAVGTTTVTATATNLVGTSILAFDVTVVDNEVPTITLNGNATITHNAFTTYADLGASATDNCGTPNVSVGGDVVDVNTVGTYVITYDAVDTSRENATQVIRTLNVIDTTKPTAIAQNVAVQLNANGNATITAAQVNNGSSDDSDASGDNLSYTLSQTSFDCSSAGNNPVTLTVTDASGNTSMATAIVTVNDIIAPSIATLTNIIVNNDAGRCGANLVILRPVTADNCLSGGTVLNFDGQNDYISINHQTEMASVNYTAEAWIYVTGGAVHKAIFSKRTPSDGFNLYVTGNTLQLWNGWSLPINGPQIQNNEWIHVAVTGNSSGQKMFVGGLLVGSTSAVVIPSSASTQFTIGVNNDGNSPWFFGGNMKNVRFWNKELTQAQIQSNMTNSVNPQSGLVLNFPMSGGNAEGNNIGIGSLADQSGNGFNGTFNNFTLNSTSSNFVADSLSGSSVIITNDYNHTANASGVYPVGTTTIQWTATDLAGNFTTSEQIVTVEDNEAPTIVSKLATVTLTASGTVIITPEDVLERGIDNCSGTITYTLSQSAFGVTDANNSPITVQLTGTDTSGNATIVPAQVTVIDPLPIVITQNITIELDENGEATINATQIDNGSNSVVGLAEEDGLSLDISTFNCSNIGNPVTVTLTVTGNNDNVSSATAIVTVEDTIVPVAITQNITIQLDVSGNASITPQDIDSSGSNDADLVGYWKFDEGSGNVVTDASGNDLNGSFADGLTWGANSPANGGSSALNFNGAYAEVADNPILNDLQDEMSIEAWIFQTDGANNAIIDRGNYNFLFMTMPNGQPGLGFYNGNDGWSYSSTPIEVNQWVHVAMTWDKSTKTLKFYKNGVEIDSFVRSSNLNFHNGGPINIGRQSPYTCSCNPMNGAMDELRLWNSVRTQDEIQNNMNSSINEQGGSSDACGIASLSLNKDTFTCANVGENIVILTVTDNNNNVSTQTAIVTVEDKVIPVITASADIHVFATSAAGAVVNYSTPVGTDNCSVTTAITIGLADGATFPIGTTVVTYVATDGSGNTASASFNVEVVGVAPVIVVPADITVNNDSGQCGALVLFAATDATGIPISDITYDTPPDTFFAVGTTTVTATATNAVGTAILTFDVTVEDTTAPVFVETLPGNITVECDSVPDAVVLTVTDNCDAPAVVYAEERTDGSSANNYTLTRTWTATDVAGNIVSHSQVITVEDTTAPVFVETLPLDVTVECSSVPEAVVLTVTDNCDAPGVVYAEESTQNADQNNAAHYNYTITRTWRSTDVTGNFTVSTQVIRVQDVTAPTITDVADITVNCQDVTTSSATGTATGTDICSAIVITQSDVSTQNTDASTYDYYNYTITRTWRSTDVTGNFTESTQVIRVQDVTKPTITDVADIRVNCQDVTTSSATGTATGTDICSAIVITQSDVSTQNADASTAAHYNYTITRTWRSTDVTGNFTESTQVIRVQDVTAPTITDVADITVNCQDVTTSSATGTATGTDICSAIVITQSDVSTQNTDASTYDYYNYTITRTWRSTD
ncbi:LamG-like jellyroll fold domain-containing protein, partial [Nonlabens sp.]|uniref:LamG-like jellyroll fold domain-containing protein n=1 Tax=Nonlabens sp. TaxID=1888209 RepID=UPI0039E3E5C9